MVIFAEKNNNVHKLCHGKGWENYCADYKERTAALNGKIKKLQAKQQNEYYKKPIIDMLLVAQSFWQVQQVLLDFFITISWEGEKSANLYNEVGSILPLIRTARKNFIFGQLGCLPNKE